jgi:hypothetical protein
MPSEQALRIKIHPLKALYSPKKFASLYIEQTPFFENTEI